MAAMSASSVTFKTAVAPRVVRSRATKLTRATRGSVATQAAVTKIPVSEVKDHLDRGFVLVDIRDPDEAQETGYKSSWKNVVVRPFTRPRLPVTRPIPTRRASSPAANNEKNRRRVLTTPHLHPPTVSTARRHGRRGQHHYPWI